jgi:hypothetical protein
LANNSGYPTILIVYEDRGFRDALIRNLKQTGSLILEAQAVEALGIVIHHSRRIHLLLADDSDDSRAMAATLKPYRPDMQIIHIGSNLDITSVLMEVSKILGSSPNLFEDNEPSRDKVRAALTAEADEARRRFLDLSREFIRVTKDVPSGMPHPDGVTRLQRPADDRGRAFDAYRKALKNLEDHIAAAHIRVRPMQKRSGDK